MTLKVVNRLFWIFVISTVGAGLMGYDDLSNIYFVGTIVFFVLVSYFSSKQKTNEEE